MSMPYGIFPFLRVKHVLLHRKLNLEFDKSLSLLDFFMHLNEIWQNLSLINMLNIECQFVRIPQQLQSKVRSLRSTYYPFLK